MKLSARQTCYPCQHALRRLPQLRAVNAQHGSPKDEQLAVLQRSLGLVLILSSRLSSPLGAHAYMLGVCPLQAQIVVCLVLLHTLQGRSNLLIAIQGCSPMQRQHVTPGLQQFHYTALHPGQSQALQSNIISRVILLSPPACIRLQGAHCSAEPDYRKWALISQELLHVRIVSAVLLSIPSAHL